MKPRRYPYSGKKESTFVKADHELVQNILIDSKSLTTTWDTNKISCGSLEAQVLAWTNMCKIADALGISIGELR